MQQIPPHNHPRHWLTPIAMAAALCVVGAPALASDEVEPLPSDWKINWTNTFKYGAAYRMNEASSTLLGSSNSDDGDRNFSKGLISNRIELLSELDAVSREGFGARVSAVGWYDSVYNRGNANPGGTQNHTSTEVNQFTNDTQTLHGRNIEVRDAFVFGKADLGGMPLNVRLGQHGLVWGESIFFASNAIAGGQSAFDISRLLADPTAQAKEFVLPVLQVSAQLQISPTFSLGAYYQFSYRANRLAAVGSYFSNTDTVGDGAERLLVSNLPAAMREADMKASESGQFGIQAKWRLDETDLGFYALRFHDKDPQQVSRLGTYSFLPAGTFVPTRYYLAYNEATTAVGVSASHSFGDVNIAAEGSVRQNQALSSGGHASDISGQSDNKGNPAYAVGKTAHLNVSTIWALQPSALWREALLVAEVAWNRLLTCDKSCSALDPNATRDAVSMRAVFEPTYRQVVSGLDLSIPFGVGYTPYGSRSSLGPFSTPPEGGGDWTLGLSGVYEQVWRFNLAYTRFFGPSGTLLNSAQVPSFTYQQTRADRDFISLTVRRSF
ncbi:MAG: DUF1302 family protein [Pseudomonadota bacterium]|nr:DUF1302 family protein [Pseudomonadota bacterium]